MTGKRALFMNGCYMTTKVFFDSKSLCIGTAANVASEMASMRFGVFSRNLLKLEIGKWLDYTTHLRSQVRAKILLQKLSVHLNCLSCFRRLFEVFLGWTEKSCALTVERFAAVDVLP